MKNTIQHTFFFPHPADMVWEYLTKPELLAKWLMQNNIKPVVGHKFQITTKPIPSLDLDGIFHCEIIEVSLNKKLSYSWKGGPEPGKTNMDTLVVWTLNPKDNGTELNLVHSGFKDPDNSALYDSMNGGWVKQTGIMSGLLNTPKNA